MWAANRDPVMFGGAPSLEYTALLDLDYTAGENLDVQALGDGTNETVAGQNRHVLGGMANFDSVDVVNGTGLVAVVTSGALTDYVGLDIAGLFSDAELTFSHNNYAIRQTQNYVLTSFTDSGDQFRWTLQGTTLAGALYQRNDGVHRWYAGAGLVGLTANGDSSWQRLITWPGSGVAIQTASSEAGLAAQASVIGTGHVVNAAGIAGDGAWDDDSLLHSLLVAQAGAFTLTLRRSIIEYADLSAISVPTS